MSAFKLPLAVKDCRDRARPSYHVVEADGAFIALFFAQDQATEFVHAVNAHDDLVAALKEGMFLASDRAAGGRMLTSVADAKGIFNKAKAALQKAGEL